MQISTANFCKQRGYTLVEMAVVMVIIGLLATAYFSYLMQERKESVRIAQKNTVENATNEIINYLNNNSRYACPARLDAVTTDADYGVSTDCNDTSVPVGTCAGGICIQKSERLDADGNEIRVRIGMYPFQTLQKAEQDAVDVFGNRLIYVVTEKLASDTVSAEDGGGISIVRRDSSGGGDVSAMSAPATGQFVLLSMGQNQVGAIRSSGTPANGCSGPGRDVINCSGLRLSPCFDAGGNTIACTTSDDAIYRAEPKTLGAGAEYFDDDIRYVSGLRMPIWEMHPDLNQNMYLRNGADLVALGLENDKVPEQKVDVIGNTKIRTDPSIAAPTGNIHARELCGRTTDGTAPADCFDPELIGGTGMHCPTGEFIIGIDHGHVRCGPGAVMCPDGKRLVGLVPGATPSDPGELVCDNPPVTCAATDVTLCTDQVRTLPAAAPGDVEYLYAGDNYYARYVCSDMGLWELDYDGGQCECVPYGPDERRDYECGYYYGNSGTPVEWWTGTIDFDAGTTCPAGDWYVNVIRENCQCICDNDPLTDDCVWEQTDACPDGLTGHIRRFDPWICEGGNPNGHWYGQSINGLPLDDDSNNVEDTCVCTGGQTENQTVPCPDGLTGGPLQQTRTFTCTSGTEGEWSEWVTTSGTCTCTNSSTYLGDGNCGTGFSGNTARYKVVTCTGNVPEITIEENRDGCQQLKYAWQPQDGSSSTLSDSPMGKKAGVIDSCLPTDPSRACYQATAGKYRNYDTCECVQQ